MHKILLPLFILVVLLFPKSEVLAAEVPKCSDQSLDPTPIQRDTQQTGKVSCPDGYVCFIPLTVKKATGEKQTNYCYKAGSIPAKTIIDSLNAGTGIQGGAAVPIQGGVSAGSTTSGPTTSAKGIPCTESKNGIMTAIGCIPTEPKALVEGLLKYGTLAAGGIAFLIMILAALQMITAEGNPEAIKGAQEKFYSAIIGLLLIIFAVLLMQVIGVDILGLPGLGKQPPAFDTSKGDSS